MAAIDYSDLFGDNSNIGESGFMRIMKFDTTTGMVNIETFASAVDFTGLSWDTTTPPLRHADHSHLNRGVDLESTYFPASGAGMDKDTASNLSFSFLDYVPITRRRTWCPAA